ncbi:TIGR02206 family membrane protein [soil metagenome]
MQVASADRFQAFGTSHLVMLVLFVVGIGVVIWWGRHHRGADGEQSRRRAFAVVVAVLAGILQIYQFTPGDYDFNTSLPLQICDVAVVVVVIALWTRSPRATAFSYYVGLTLTIQAVLTPALASDFPDPRFFAFWGMHLGIVWAACYLTWGLGWRPTWRLYGFAVATTALWAVSVIAFNYVVGTNYGYLMSKPSTASVLDLLGPWPWYVVAEVAIISAFWLLVMTVPWEISARRKLSRSVGER